jgi:hypothetical protein
MKNALIYLMIGMYLFGNFSQAFAEPRSHSPQFQKKHRSDARGHKPKFQRKPQSAPKAHQRRSQKRAESAPRTDNPRFQRKPQSTPKAHHRRFQKRAESAPRTDNPRFQRKPQSVPRVHKPQVKQRPHRTAPRVNQPHVVQKHRTAPRVRKHRTTPRVQKHRSFQKHRHTPRVHRPRVWRKYRPFPRVHYGHRHPYGHRVHILPHGFISFSISGLIYYYAYGNYYRNYSGYYMVVTPPIGALIPVPPPGYRMVYIDSHPYYLSGGVYYIWDNVHRGYRVVPPPEEIHEFPESGEGIPEPIEDFPELFVYPKAGQSEDEQANDRYDCHLWAVGETDFDPSQKQSSTEKERSDFRRAITACLEARDYTVK